MFSKVEATQLRQDLQSIEFLHDGAEPKQLGADATRLYAAYKRYYGLNFAEQFAELNSTSSTIGVFSSGTYQLVCQHFLPSQNPPRKTIFLLHGYFDHAGLYRHLIAHLLRRDIAVIIFDLPGHGLSSGEAASINTFREYNLALSKCLDIAKQQLVALPWLAIGQSTGAAIIMDTLLEKIIGRESSDECLLEDFILLGPLLRPRQWRRSKVLFSISKLFLASTPRKFSKNSHDAEFLQFLKSKDALQSRNLPSDWVQAMSDYINRFEAAPIQTQSLQVIQGRGDGTVEWETNIPKILAKFPGSKVHWVDDAGHHLVNESPRYRDQVFATIDRLLE